MSTAKEERMNSYTTFSYELLHMDTPVLDEEQKFIFISSEGWLSVV